MIESMRAFGYSLPNAVADLIDNSITAEAGRVEVTARWYGPHSWLRVSDNGLGMEPAKLVEAMRLGGRSPLEARAAGDLGRFGLGLKTASFSQCRRLTVRSKARSFYDSTRCWDLDVVQELRSWALINGTLDGTDPDTLIPDADSESGTVVLWEKLDRVVGNEPAENQTAAKRFWRQMDLVSRHLGMVFHRFLVGSQALRIQVNEVPVHPWDPFMTASRFTQPLPSESFGAAEHAIRVQPYVLPHQSKLEDEEHQEAAGEKGWNAHQGFYIYRDRRLLVPGDWLGMFKQEEHYKLARIQVDIQNAADADWKIDVRKAQAVPPDWTRDFLRRIADATRELALSVYRHRGMVHAREKSREYSYLWIEIQRHGKVHYRINRDHPIVKHLLEEATISPADLESVLTIVEESVPVPLILAHFAANADRQGAPFENLPSELKDSLFSTAQILRSKAKLPVDAVRKLLLAMEPFGAYPEAVMALEIE